VAYFPVHYRPRPYQAELHQMWRDKRVGLAVLPRQSGKDTAMSMESVDRRLRTPKTTGVYVSLDNPMIRDILWDKTYLDPETGHYIRMLQDNVPANLCTWRNTSMTGHFSNHSRLKLQGYFQSGRDKNGVGTSFQDYAFTELALFMREDPLPRLMPIISNEAEPKRLMVASTPRGKRRNPLWQLMKAFEGSKDYQVIIRTIDDLNEMMRRAGLPPVRSQAQLDQDREAYRRRFGNDRMFEQEFYVSFEEMDAAAIYGEAYMKMLSEHRVVDFNLNSSQPVYVVFDIGAAGMHSDATSWIAFQWYNNRLFIYDAGEGHGRALPEYVDTLREKHWFSQLATIILPWDAEHHEKSVTTTPADMMREKFHSVAVLAKSSKVWKLPGGRQGDFTEITDIQQTRMVLYNTLIHETNCQWVCECIENYKYEFDTRLQEWSQRPVHDRYSHMMDALRYAVQATKELNFFGGRFFEDSGVPQTSTSYEDDWTGVWGRVRI
jgi:hypothetical protein